jgi:DeoR family transcriptional regulator, glycerol-3-phosphate regulon repressor
MAARSTAENIADRQRQQMNQAAKGVIARTVAGGQVRARDRGIVGEATVDFMRQFRVDIGISGIEADICLSDFDFHEIKFTQAIVHNAREVWLAADRAEFNRPAMVEAGRTEQIDMLFTDHEPPAPFSALLVEAGVQCNVAGRTE